MPDCELAMFQVRIWEEILTNSFLCLFEPADLILACQWGYEDGGDQGYKGDYDGTRRCVSYVSAQEPSSNGKLDNICPELVNISDGSHNNIHLYNLSVRRLDPGVDLTSEDMSVTAAESSVAVVLSSVALENTAETSTPRNKVTDRALRCQ